VIVGLLLINWGIDHPQSLVNSRQDHGDRNGSTSPIVGMCDDNRTNLVDPLYQAVLISNLFE
jgi:multisubunit Na+/H+ antiporter MnhC subunit